MKFHHCFSRCLFLSLARNFLRPLNGLSFVSMSVSKARKSVPNIFHIECAYVKTRYLGKVAIPKNKNCVQQFRHLWLWSSVSIMHEGNDNDRLSLFSIKYIRQLLKISLHQMHSARTISTYAHTHTGTSPARSSRQTICTTELRNSTATCRQRCRRRENDDRSCKCAYVQLNAPHESKSPENQKKKTYTLFPTSSLRIKTHFVIHRKICIVVIYMW